MTTVAVNSRGDPSTCTGARKSAGTKTVRQPHGGSCMNALRQLGLIRLSWIVLTTGTTLFLALTGLQAHDAIPTSSQPLGWKYPWACCSGMDCSQVSSSAIGITPDGYQVKSNGETLSYSDKRLRDSPDGEYHLCTKGGKPDGETICLFKPSPGS